MTLAVGVGVVVRRHGRLLLGRRVKLGEPVSWSLPGGTLEPGESFETAARRELMEETGLRCDDVTVFALGLTPLADGSSVWTAGVVTERAAGEARVLATHEFATLDWFDPAELPSPLFGPTRFVLDRLAGRDSPAALAAYSVDGHSSSPEVPLAGGDVTRQ